MEASEDIDRADYSFRSYGILTFILMPFIWSSVLIGSGPGILFTMMVFSIFFYVFENRVESSGIVGFLARLIITPFYFILRITFGLKVSKKNSRQFRFYWFFSLGALLSFLAAMFTFFSFIVVIPLLFVLFKRQQTLKFFFRIALLPRGEYFGQFLGTIPSAKQMAKAAEARQELENVYQYSNQYEYYQFYPPNRISRITAYLMLLMIPLVLNGVAIFIINLVTGRSWEKLVGDTFRYSLEFAYLAILPYLVLSLLRDKRYNKFVTTKMAENIVKGLAYSSSSSIPMISGDYFVEQNSRSMDMHHNFGFFEIFRGGRILTMILLPLSIYSFIFGQLIKDTPGNDLTASGFIDDYFSLIKNHYVQVFLLIGVPLLISTILPLTWCLADAEIKRSTWTNDEGPSDVREISGVEDLGSTISRFVSFFIGVSAITGLTSILSNLFKETSATNDSFVVYKIFGVIVFSGILIVFPGTMLMAYRYFSLGDHAYGVNYLRYHLSQDRNIGVGTIHGQYEKSYALPEPLSPHIRQMLKLGEPAAESPILEIPSENQSQIDDTTSSM